MFNKAFEDLVESPEWKGHFIGYGNPDADILIIGQEAALDEGSQDWKQFYLPNQEHWHRILTESLSFRDGWERGDRPYTFPEFFSPLHPYYKQEFNRKCTSDTYYWYQVLIDGFYEHLEDSITGRPCRIIDFFRHAFITELNEQPRRNHGIKQPIRDNIRARFDLMKTAKPFWSRFKVVVLACGHYADALKEDPQLYSDVFGDTPKVFCSQLSMNPAKSEIARITPEIKSILVNE